MAEAMSYTSQLIFLIIQSPNLETRIVSQKKSERCEENSLPQAKNSLGFGKLFSEFAKGIDETCVRNFFNVVLTAGVVFLIVQFILFLCFGSND